MATISVSEPANRPWQTYLILTLGLLATSLAAIFIRMAQDEQIPSLVIAAARLVIATVVLTIPVLRHYRSHIIRLTRRDFLLIAGAGFFLASHFMTWITSLEHTTILIASVLTTTSPLWIALLERFLFNTSLTLKIVLGLFIAIGGGIVISLPSGDTTLALGSNPLVGGILASLAALSFAFYLVIGRSVRPKLPLMPYIWLVYGSASITALLVVALTSTPLTGYSTEGYLWVLGVALIPQLVGHSALNYVLRFLSATLVGIAGQLEPIATAIMAIIIFGEVPGLPQFIGSLLMVLGVTLAVIGQRDTS